MHTQRTEGMAILFPVRGGLEIKVQPTQEPPKVDKSTNEQQQNRNGGEMGFLYLVYTLRKLKIPQTWMYNFLLPSNPSITFSSCYSSDPIHPPAPLKHKRKPEFIHVKMLSVLQTFHIGLFAQNLAWSALFDR